MRIGLIFCLFFVLFSCQNSGYKKVKNSDFERYKLGFVDRFWEMNPGWASGVGVEHYDSILVVPTDLQRLKEIDFLKNELIRLHTFNPKDLTSNNQIDFELIENQLKSSLWGLQTFKSFEWDPTNFNLTGGIAELLNSAKRPLKNRLDAIYIRLGQVPAYYKAAKASLKTMTKEHNQLAIDQSLGGMSVLTEDLRTKIGEAHLNKKEVELFEQRIDAAVGAINGYIYFLKKQLNGKHISFRIARDKYAQKFAFDLQTSYTPETLFEKALKHKAKLHLKMVQLSKKMWKKYMGSTPQPKDELLLVRKLIDTLSIQHVKRDSFQISIERQIPTLVEFVKKKDLLYLDPSKPLVVRKEPAYMAGVAGASISAPGPYDKKANTYYNVGSLNGWSDEQAESYLREYNNYILQILNIHEAIPGHYTQLVYSNQSPSIIKSLFGNGAMVEGWAVYTELMMLENGYGNFSPELWLMYYKWNLRTTCNTIIDYAIHNLKWSKEKVIRLLTKEAFQQQAEAEGKWKRATLTQVQLCSYFCGFSEIMDLRTSQKMKKGEAFDLKKFHSKFLSFGSAPVRSIRTLMEE